MPNTGPIRTRDDVHHYYDNLVEIRDRLGLTTEIVMTLYFTKLLTPRIIEALAKLPFRCEIKYYPPEQGATTGSGFGMPLSEGDNVLWAMRDCKIPLLGHFESVNDRSGNPLPHGDREGYFLTQEYPRVRERHPELLISIEHGSTIEAVERVIEDTSGRTVITITPHHLLFNMPELLTKSWQNHGRCMPYLKGPEHQARLVEFAFSGDIRAIAGSDIAPHPSKKKLGAFEDAACGCWLPHAEGLYILAAHRAGVLNDDFVHFMCYNGADWRGLPRPTVEETITVVGCESPGDIPEPVVIPGADDVVIPLGWSTEADRLQIGHTLLDQMHCSH